MEKRYQVFISSTFMDLKNARQEVSQALLRADCFPAGMELFPAADEEQFEFIKTIIDQSDYYILISAGRYGSIHPETGLSYTEMEYDYAVETGKPIIRLLHRDPFKELRGEFIEASDDRRNSLRQFRKKVSSTSLVKFWATSEQLGLEVTLSILDCIKRKPASGWIKTSQNRDTSNIEIEKKNAEILELTQKLLKQSEQDEMVTTVSAAQAQVRGKPNLVHYVSKLLGSSSKESSPVLLECLICRGSGKVRAQKGFFMVEENCPACIEAGTIDCSSPKTPHPSAP